MTGGGGRGDGWGKISLERSRSVIGRDSEVRAAALIHAWRGAAARLSAVTSDYFSQSYESTSGPLDA